MNQTVIITIIMYKKYIIFTHTHTQMAYPPHKDVQDMAYNHAYDILLWATPPQTGMTAVSAEIVAKKLASGPIHVVYCGPLDRGEEFVRMVASKMECEHKQQKRKILCSNSSLVCKSDQNLCTFDEEYVVYNFISESNRPIQKIKRGLVTMFPRDLAKAQELFSGLMTLA